MAATQSPLERVCRTWLQANLDHFRIQSSSSTVEVFRNLKPFGELVLLAGINRHASRGSLKELQSQLRTWIKQNVPNATHLAEVGLEFPQTLPWLGLIWQNLELIGLPAPQLRVAVERLLGVKSILHFERHVAHDICVHHIIESLDRRSPFDLRELYSRTMIAKKAWDDPSVTAIYYICHDVFFLTNWGKFVLRHPLRPPNAWRIKLRSWYDGCLASGNIDLAAELAMALSFLRDRADLKPLSSDRQTSHRQTRLPQPPTGQGDGFISAGDSEDRIRFFRNYHTVIVCLIALSRLEHDRA